MSLINPYVILGVSEDDDIEHIEAIYKNLAKLHHPDKTGDSEQFDIVRNAFKMILKTKQSELERKHNMREKQIQYDTSKFSFNPAKQSEFNRENFNKQFESTSGFREKEEDMRINRSKNQFMAEQSDVDNELSKITKINFSGQGFDNTTFQKLFEYINGKPDDTFNSNSDPSSATDIGYQPFTDVNTGETLGEGPFSTYGKSFNGKHAQNVNGDLIKELAQKPDITTTNVIDENSRSKMKNKMGQYNNVSFDLPSQEEGMRFIKRQEMPSTMNARDTDSEFQRKLSERNNLFGQRQPIQTDRPMPTGIMDYPVSSGVSRNTGNGLGQSQDHGHGQNQMSNLSSHPSMFMNQPMQNGYLPQDMFSDDRRKQYYSQQIQGLNQAQTLIQNQLPPPYLPTQMNIGPNPVQLSMPLQTPPVPPFIQNQGIPMNPSPNDQFQRQLDEMKKTIYNQNEIIRKLAPNRK